MQWYRKWSVKSLSVGRLVIVNDQSVIVNNQSIIVNIQSDIVNTQSGINPVWCITLTLP